MLVKTVVLSAHMQEEFAGHIEIDALSLMITAEPREDEARRRGAEWTAGAISFFGQELITAVRMAQSERQLEKLALNVAMFAWLYDSIYAGVSDEVFMQSTLVFTMLPDGVIKYDRVAA